MPGKRPEPRELDVEIHDMPMLAVDLDEVANVVRSVGCM
jgi:hypothetical protein